jgi:hypothetical protein
MFAARLHELDPLILELPVVPSSLHPACITIVRDLVSRSGTRGELLGDDRAVENAVGR